VRLSLRLISLIVLLASIACLQAASEAMAQKVTEPVDLNARDPRLKEGRLLSIRIIPEGKNLEIEVAGNKAVEVNYGNIGLSAKLFVGDRPIELKSRRTSVKPLRFQIEALEQTKGKMRIELRSESIQETFEMENIK
jgi:hypothetical protein